MVCQEVIVETGFNDERALTFRTPERLGKICEKMAVKDVMSQLFFNHLHRAQRTKVFRYLEFNQKIISGRLLSNYSGDLNNEDLNSKNI